MNQSIIGQLESEFPEIAARMREQRERSQEQVAREARLFAECFDTKAGREVLALLLERTIYRVPPDYEAPDPASYVIKCARREGQANLVLQIFRQIDIARGVIDDKQGA